MPGTISNGVSAQNTFTDPVARTGNEANEENFRNITRPQNCSLSPTIEQQYHDLQLVHKRLQDDLKRLQQQEFNSHNKGDSQSHHVLSAQFFDVFRLSTDWARDYFKIPFRDFRIDDYELFKRNLDRVLCGGCHWAKKKKMNVSHLVQAVVADVLARRVLLLQFAGCSESARHEFSQIYNAMLNEDESKALKWRAAMFATYERCEVWAPLDSSTPREPILSFRQKFYKSVAGEIDAIVGPIAKAHFPNRGSEERFQRSMEFIEAAGKLAVTLGAQAAKLEIMDKSWFERSQRVFICKDDRMKGRFAEEYRESGGEFQVDIILRPGFLKYGNDEGKDLEKYAVWIPAMLDLGKKDPSNAPFQAEAETESSAHGKSPELAVQAGRGGNLRIRFYNVFKWVTRPFSWVLSKAGMQSMFFLFFVPFIVYSLLPYLLVLEENFLNRQWPNEERDGDWNPKAWPRIRPGWCWG